MDADFEKAVRDELRRHPCPPGTNVMDDLTTRLIRRAGISNADLRDLLLEAAKVVRERDAIVDRLVRRGWPGAWYVVIPAPMASGHPAARVAEYFNSKEAGVAYLREALGLNTRGVR
jgi:hypothetical protein